MKVKSIYFLILIFFASSIFAADENAATQLRKQLDAMNSLQGNFVQTLFDKEGKKQDQSSGTFVLSRPGKFLWKTEKPAPQLLISNQKKIWLYDPDLQTVNIRPFSDDLKKTPVLLLNEDVTKLRKDFTINLSVQDQSEVYSITPKVTEGLFQELKLVFTNDQVVEFSIRDSLGQVTHFALSDTQRNLVVDDNQFNFVPPPGTDIIKNQ